MYNYSFDEDNDEIGELRIALNKPNCQLIFIKNPWNQFKLNQIKSLIKEFEQRSCWLNCLELFNFNNLFGEIFNKILRPVLDPNEHMIVDDHFWNDMDVGNLDNFIKKIDSKIKTIKHKHLIIVLENTETLVERNSSHLKMLIKLNELVNMHFTIVMISGRGLDHFQKIGITLNEIYTINFSTYTIDKIEEIILTTRPERFSDSSYSRFVNLIVKTLSNHTRDLDKLRFICEKFFDKWLKESQLDESNARTFMKEQEFIMKNMNEIQSSLILQTANRLDMIFELSCVSKFLLVSAYLASYNSKSSDKIFFSKFAIKKKHRKKSIAFSNEKHVTGPGKFTFERLYQIYNSLQDQWEDQRMDIVQNDLDEMHFRKPTNLLFEQFKTLISQKIIHIAESEATHSRYSSLSKYCIADYITDDFIKEIASSIGLEIEKFMEKNLVKL